MKKILVIIAFTIIAVGIAHALDRLALVKTFGQKSDPARGGLNRVYDFALDKKGNIYLADNYNSKILKFGPDGKFLLQFGTFGAATGTINSPNRIAVDSQGNIYVVDYHDLSLEKGPQGEKASYYRVQKFDPAGNVLWAFGASGKGEGEFYGQPADLEIDGQDNLYVADSGNYRIQKFSPEGDFILQFGKFGSQEGQFDYPAMVVADKNGDLFVSDYNNQRIQKFDRNGKFLLKFGKEGYNEGEFKNPNKIYIDKDGGLGVISSFTSYNSGKRRLLKLLVHKYDTNGKYQNNIYAVERYYDDDTYYYFDLLNCDREDNLYLFHSRDKSVNKYHAMPAGLNWNSISKNYYLELRRPAEGSSYIYDATGYHQKTLQDYLGINPIQTINFNYEMSDRSTLGFQNTLSYAASNGPKYAETTTDTSTLDATRNSFYADSSLQYSYVFDKTKNKNIAYNLGYSTSKDKYGWVNPLATNEAQDSAYDRIYANVNVDVSDFSDIEFGYNKYSSNSGFDSKISAYNYTNGSANDYYYLKYHADF